MVDNTFVTDAIKRRILAAYLASGGEGPFTEYEQEQLSKMRFGRLTIEMWDSSVDRICSYCGKRPCTCGAEDY